MPVGLKINPPPSLKKKRKNLELTPSLFSHDRPFYHYPTFLIRMFGLSRK
jgi:hypothetical protein